MNRAPQQNGARHSSRFENPYLFLFFAFFAGFFVFFAAFFLGAAFLAFFAAVFFAAAFFGFAAAFFASGLGAAVFFGAASSSGSSSPIISSSSSASTSAPSPSSPSSSSSSGDSSVSSSKLSFSKFIPSSPGGILPDVSGPAQPTIGPLARQKPLWRSYRIQQAMSRILNGTAGSSACHPRNELKFVTRPGLRRFLPGAAG